MALPDTMRSLAATATPPEPGANEHDPVKLHMAAVAVGRAIGRALAAQ